MIYSSEVTGKLIHLERERKNWSQSKLGNKIGVSGKQISNYEHGKLSPPIDILFLLCQEFNCELGYLLGEEDYCEGSKIQTTINNVTGLSTAAIDAIKEITGTERYCPSFGHESEKYRCIINTLLTSGHFRYFIECLSSLDNCIFKFKDVAEQLEEELGSELYEKAMQVYCSTVDYEHNSAVGGFPPELCNAIKQIQDVIEHRQELSYSTKVARYELQEAFAILIDDIYPKNI